MLDILYLLAFGSSCSLICYSVEYLFERKSGIDRAVTFSVCLLWGIATLFLLYMAIGVYRSYPQFLYLSEPFELLLGPLMYYRFRLLLEGKIRFDRLAFFLFLPTALALAWFMPFFLLSPAEKLASVGFHNIRSALVRDIYLAIVDGQTPIFVLCVILFIAQVPKLLSAKGIRLMLSERLLVIYCLAWIAISIAGYVFLFLQQNAMIAVMIILANYMIIVSFRLDRKYSGYFLSIQKDASEVRYSRSMLGGIDTEAVMARLRELMELEETYLDAELSLPALAARLSIKPHQLSEILNRRLGSNFRAYVNSYRVRTAKRMLLDDERQSVLMIAFLSGFNSKNAFYAAFSKEEGMSPSDFREKARKHS
jgi:AraC-like DNA-binding protein